MIKTIRNLKSCECVGYASLGLLGVFFLLLTLHVLLVIL